MHALLKKHHRHDCNNTTGNEATTMAMAQRDTTTMTMVMDVDVNDNNTASCAAAVHRESEAV
jgi:hypothetical protein